MVKPYFETENGKLYHGDCLEIMKDIPDKSIDMILCDLPYGVTACRWDTPIPLKPLWGQYERVIKDNGAIILTGTQPFASTLIMSNYTLFRYELIWDKELITDHLNAYKMPLKVHENILVFYKSLPTYNPQKVLGEKNHKTGGSEKKSNVYGAERLGDNSDILGNWKFPKSILKVKKIHPALVINATQKPIELFRYLILTYTNTGETVLDNCIGSGTTAVASEQVKRKWIGMEKDTLECQKAAKRIRAETRQLTIT